MNIICMKWGNKFPVEYVNRLYAMVSRNMIGDFRFVCFTENTITTYNKSSNHTQQEYKNIFI